VGIRVCVRNELFRFARRNLTNALQESQGEEFRQLILMLKLMETNLASKFDNFATCSCKAPPQGDSQIMKMLESMVQGQQDLFGGQQDLQKQFMEQFMTLASRLDNSQSEVRGVCDRLNRVAERLSITTDLQRALSTAGSPESETRGVAQKLSSTARLAVSRHATVPLRQGSRENEIKMMINETGLHNTALEAKKTALLDRLKLRRSHGRVILSTIDDESRRGRTASAHEERGHHWHEGEDFQSSEDGHDQHLNDLHSGNDQDLERPAEEVAVNGFERAIDRVIKNSMSPSRHRSRQDKRHVVQDEQYLPKEQEHLSLQALHKPIGGHAVHQLRLHRAQSYSRLSPLGGFDLGISGAGDGIARSAEDLQSSTPIVLESNPPLPLVQE
jgi:hypothetical protein